MPGYTFEYTTRVTVTADSLVDARELLNRKGWDYEGFVRRQTVPVVRYPVSAPCKTESRHSDWQQTGSKEAQE